LILIFDQQFFLKLVPHPLNKLEIKETKTKNLKSQI